MRRGGEGIVRRCGKEKEGEEQPEMGWNFHDNLVWVEGK